MYCTFGKNIIAIGYFLLDLMHVKKKNIIHNFQQVDLDTRHLVVFNRLPVM
jgi:hypothetical protein